MGRERKEEDLDCEHAAQKWSEPCAVSFIQDSEPLHFSIIHMKGEETPMSILLVQELGSEFSSLGNAELSR